ncbi:MAG: hypothetical protein K9K86_03290 [Pseudomonadales bacterium]|nr:hypothetical protein [Pseudomonadales bacterium]
MSPQCILTDNIQALTSGAGILKRLSHEQYNQVSTPYFSASVGKHFRHILDHYLSFISGLNLCHINYDQRDRNTCIETDIEYALSTLQKIIETLSTLRQQNNLNRLKGKQLSVTLCTSFRNKITKPVTSSVQRELVFLQGHTIHHYAIIAAILKFEGVTVDHHFGVAASTLKYQEETQCAR